MQNNNNNETTGNNFNTYYNSNDRAYSYQQYLEENINLKKIISKLEILIEKERSEKVSIQSLYEDFKLMHEKTRKELQEMSLKLTNSKNEKNTLEKKQEIEINKIKQHFDKQKQAYESQILKLSAIDFDNLKTKITLECESEFKKEINIKNNEIENLNDKLLETNKKYELILAEYEGLKDEALKEIDALKEGHKSEVRELLFKIQILTDKNEGSMNKENLRDLKNNYDLIKKQNVEYLSEINSLRREKEGYLLEKNDVRLALMKEIDAEKMKFKVSESENQRKDNLLKNMEFELSHIKTKFDDKSDEIKLLIEEKYNLAQLLREKDLDFESFKAEVKTLRLKVDERDKELTTTLQNTSNKEKQMFIQDKQEKEELIQQIEDITMQLKDSQFEFKNFYEKANEEIHVFKRDFYIISEEKRNLQNRVVELQNDMEFFKDDYDKKTKNNQQLERECASLQDKYRELCVKEADFHKEKLELETKLKNITEELNSTLKNNNNLIKMLKESNSGNNDKKLKDLIFKKEQYKNKVIN